MVVTSQLILCTSYRGLEGNEETGGKKAIAYMVACMSVCLYIHLTRCVEQTYVGYCNLRKGANEASVFYAHSHK